MLPYNGCPSPCQAAPYVTHPPAAVKSRFVCSAYSVKHAVMPTVMVAASSTTCVSYIAEIVPTRTDSHAVNSSSTIKLVGWLRRAVSEHDRKTTSANEAAKGVQKVHGLDQTKVLTGADKQNTAVTAAVIASCKVRSPAGNVAAGGCDQQVCRMYVTLLIHQLLKRVAAAALKPADVCMCSAWRADVDAAGSCWTTRRKLLLHVQA